VGEFGNAEWDFHYDAINYWGRCSQIELSLTISHYARDMRHF